MNVIFMGTPQFAVPCLERLLAEGHHVLAAVSQPDRPRGRKLLLAPTPVKACALAHQIPVLQPQKLKGNDDFLAQLRALAPDLIVVVAYGKILPQALLNLPPYGCVNVHASLLPQYRGAAPIQWAVLEGQKETGVTTMQMDAGLDTGDMLLQVRMPVGGNITAGELHDTLSLLGAQALSDTLNRLALGKLTPVPQTGPCTYAPMLPKAMSPLDFSRPAPVLYNQVRGLHPWPCATAEYAGRQIKVHAARITQVPQGLSFLCGDGQYLQLLIVQAEGKKAMPAEEFLRGIR
ncbi:MAG: methionyl-tRNA formyltransferase [Oscillospiraceae bacterium]|nr:methionyl-tRNA formyltransferase [Oscillospiraceae bacterium]